MLEALVTAVMPAVVAAVPTAQHAFTTRDPGHSAPPRLVWRPVSDAFGPPRRQTTAPPRPVASIRMTLSVEIWGESIAQVETLREAVLRGLHATIPGGWQAQGGTWAAEGIASLGELYTLVVAVEGQQHDATPTTAVLTDASITPPAAPLPGQLDSGDTTT